MNIHFQRLFFHLRHAMPSFLSKVLGRKKKDDKDEPPRVVRDSTGESLLGDKFVEVSPTVSPTAAQFTETDELGVRGRDNENGRFSLFRIRSGPTSPSSLAVNKRVEGEVPVLSLNLTLPHANESSASPRALGVIFDADPDAQNILPEVVIGEKRLTPQETLVLVRACSHAIKVRGVFNQSPLSFRALLIYYSRPGDSRDHASPLVFCLSGRSTQINFIVHTIIGSKSCDYHTRSIISNHSYFGVRV
jgi:hypothetical protein